MTKAIREEEYRMATRDFVGWCTTCEDFTRDCTEGDAEAYDCPQCEGNTVMGAENALIAGEITFKNEGHNGRTTGTKKDSETECC